MAADSSTMGRQRRALEQAIAGLPRGSVEARDAGAISPAEFASRYVDANRPVVLKGAAAHWPAHAKLRDFGALTELLGVSHLIVRTSDELQSEDDGAARLIDGQPDSGGRVLPVAEAVALLCSATHAVCVDSTPILESPAEIDQRHARRDSAIRRGAIKRIPDDDRAAIHVSGLLPHLGGYAVLPAPPPPKNYDRWRAFIYRRSYTPLHDHPTDETLMTQVAGNKRTLVVHPSLTPAVEEAVRTGTTVSSSSSAPLVYDADVDSGDALYIPMRWGHAVHCVDDEPGLTVAHTFASPFWKHGRLSSAGNRALWKRAIDKRDPRLALGLGAAALAYAMRTIYPGTSELQL